MTRLGVVMTQAVVHHYRRDELLRLAGKSVLVSVLRGPFQNRGHPLRATPAAVVRS